MRLSEIKPFLDFLQQNGKNWVGLQLVDPPANWDNLKEYEASGWKYRCEGNIYYLIMPNNSKVLKILTEG